MERGQLGIAYQPTTVFIFDGLIATCGHPRVEKLAVTAARWERALACWDWNMRVLDHMHDMLSRFEAHIEVITWRPTAFAQLVHDRLWEMDVPVSETTSALSYQSASQRIATDQRITAVYDGDPTHRHGYGFKAREFTAGQM
jgi:hypothetical protein